MKRIILAFAIIIASFVSAIFVNTMLFESRQVAVTGEAVPASPGKDYASLLSRAIQFKTITTHSHPGEFDQFNNFLENQFPLAFNTLNVVKIGQHNRLLTWNAKNSARAPVLFITHSDVVAAVSDKLTTWSQPPYAGVMDENHIWGRGALDNKANIIAQLSAVENMLAQGQQPETGLMFFIAEDEETGGLDGAVQANRYLLEHNIKPGFILDEGGLVTHGIVPFINSPAALVGIAEKGYLSLTLTAQQTGGHASMPPANTAIGTLSSALHALEQNGLPHTLTTPVKSMFDYLGPEMHGPVKALFANQWLFEKTLLNRLSRTASTNASIQSTLAITQINGGIAENVLPQTASATINIRLLPGYSIAQAVEHVRETIDNENIRIEVAGNSHEASLVSDTDSEFFSHLQQTIRQVFPDTLVAPYLTVTATDSRHFENNGNVYRFSPYPAGPDDLARIHGTDERIAIEDLNRMVQFYQTLFSRL